MHDLNPKYTYLKRSPFDCSIVHAEQHKKNLFMATLFYSQISYLSIMTNSLFWPFFTCPEGGLCSRTFPAFSQTCSLTSNLNGCFSSMAVTSLSYFVRYNCTEGSFTSFWHTTVWFSMLDILWLVSLTSIYLCWTLGSGEADSHQRWTTALVKHKRHHKL